MRGRLAIRKGGDGRRRRSVVVMVESLEGRTLLSLAPAAPLLVQLGSANASVVQPIAEADGASLKPSGMTGVLEATGTDQSLGKLAQNLAAVPGLGYVQRVGTLSISRTPNDPKFTDGTLWGLNGTYGINAPTAWNITMGSNTVTIADIDTGIDYNHQDLYNNVWINQPEIPASRVHNLTDFDGDGIISFGDLNYTAKDGSHPNQGPGKITDVNGNGIITAADILAPMVVDSNGIDTGKGGWVNPDKPNTQDGDTAHPNDLIGWNFVNNTNNPFDDNGHGTHTAGTIGAVGNNGVGVVGVNWQVQIMALKFLDSSGQGSDLNAALAVEYAALHGARVSNNSYGGGSGGSVLANAITDAANKGDVFVAAAGNSSQNTDVNPDYPSAYPNPNIIAVAAIGSDGNLASFSNYGPTTVDIGAPGVNVYSTLPNQSYGFLSGTSMATPHVTGTVGLLLAEHPGWTYSQLIQQVLSSATPDSSLAGKTVTGGILNAAAALGGARAGAVADPGFEQVQVGAGQFKYRPTGSPWIFAGGSGISGNNSGFTSGNPPAPQGTQVAFLQGTGSFSQTVTGWAAGSYVLTFDAAQRANYQASRQNFRVLVDGVVVDTFTPSGTSYQSYSTSAFTVTAGSHTIAFQGLDSAGGDNTAFVDSVIDAKPGLIGDPGFEQVQVGAGQFQYRPAGSPWTFSGNSGISGNNSGFTSGNPPAPEGTQVAFLQGTGSFSQPVTNWVAGSYVLTFDAAQRGNYQASRQNFRVLVDGVVVGTFTPSGTSYQSYFTSAFTVTAGSHTIAFQGLDSAEGDNTAFVDQAIASPQKSIII
jgi:subtilisin family serine protease